MAADTNKPDGNGAAQDSAAQQTPQINVLGQYVKDLSFENPKAPNSLREPGDNPNLNVEVNVNARRIEENIYESEIQFNAKTNSTLGDLYQIELVYGGAFRLANFPEEALQPVLLINCPSILFPFLRRLVADVTREGGFPPLLLDPIDFAGLYAKNRARAADSEKEQDTPVESGNV
ncbi:MAG: protein-export chaperone SecB [Hyphomicrobiaceae bacterium]